MATQNENEKSELVLSDVEDSPGKQKSELVIGEEDVDDVTKDSAKDDDDKAEEKDKSGEGRKSRKENRESNKNAENDAKRRKKSRSKSKGKEGEEEGGEEGKKPRRVNRRSPSHERKVEEREEAGGEGERNGKRSIRVEIQQKTDGPKIITLRRNRQKAATDAEPEPSAEEEILKTIRAQDPRKVIVSEKATTSLRVDKLTRPLHTKSLQTLLSAFGEVIAFYLSPIKDHCYVTFPTKTIAQVARNTLNGLQWPDKERAPLECDFVHPSEVEELLRADLNPTKKAKPAGGDEKPTAVLDSLFKRTKAKPAIYWALAQEPERDSDRGRRRDRSSEKSREKEREKEKEKEKAEGREKEKGKEKEKTEGKEKEENDQIPAEETNEKKNEKEKSGGKKKSKSPSSSSSSSSRSRSRSKPRSGAN